MFEFIAIAAALSWLHDHWETALFILCGLIALIFLIRNDKRNKAMEARRMAEIQQAQSRREEAENRERGPEERGGQITFPAEVNGVPLAYRYEKVSVSPLEGLSPESFFDASVSFAAQDGGVLAFARGQEIGKIASARIAGMVSDWIQHGEPLLAFVTLASDRPPEIKINIAFYRDQYQYLLRRYPDAKKYKLTGTHSEEMQSRLADLKPGTPCTLEFDAEKGKYAVLDGWEIGYLPASAAKIVNENDAENVKIYIAETDTDDNWNTVVFVHLFA